MAEEHWLVKKLENAKVPDDALDGCVIDLCCKTASNINNGGFAAQVLFLNEQLGVSEVQKMVNEIIAEIPDST